MLAGHKCPIKCNWHLQGWTGSVHLYVDESSTHSPMSDQFDVVCCATTMSIRIIEQAYCGHRPRGLKSQAASAKMAKERHKTTASRLKTFTRGCKIPAKIHKANYKKMQTDYKESVEAQNNFKVDTN